MHTKINYSKYEYTRYLLFIAYFLSIFCITTINTSSSSNNNRQKAQQPTQRVSFISFFIFFYFFSFLEVLFTQLFARWTSLLFRFFGFSVFQLSVSRFTQFSFSLFSICRPNMIYLWVLHAMAPNPLNTVYESKQSRYSCMHIFSICNICRGKKSRALKCTSIKHMKAGWKKSIIIIII